MMEELSGMHVAGVRRPRLISMLLTDRLPSNATIVNTGMQDVRYPLLLDPVTLNCVYLGEYCNSGFYRTNCLPSGDDERVESPSWSFRLGADRCHVVRREKY